MPRTSPLDTKLHWLKQRTSQSIDIALERVIAHNENPSYFPLPSDSKSLERALHRLFQTLPRKNQKDLIDKVNTTLKASTAQRKQIYGDLAEVDFRSSVSIVDQVKVKPVPANLQVTEADLTEIRSRLKLKPAKPITQLRPPRPTQIVEATELAFEVVSLTCTKPSDVRTDEVNIAGSALDNVGGALQLAPFFVGKFKKGETLPLGAKGRVFNFKLTVGAFPKTFVAVIFLVEKDLLRNSDFVNALITFCAVAALALSVISLGMIVVGVLGGPGSVALVVGVLVAEMLLGAASSVISKMRDDVSFPASDALTLDAPVAPGTTFDRAPLSLDVTARGKYQAAIRWVTA